MSEKKKVVPISQAPVLVRRAPEVPKIKASMFMFPEHGDLTREVYRRLVAEGNDITVFTDTAEVPEPGSLVITTSRQTFCFLNNHYKLIDLSHGVMWGKMGKEVFKEYDFSEMYYFAYSNWELGLLRRKGILEKFKLVFITGRPDLDILYQAEMVRKPNRKPVIQYCPTWNFNLNGGLTQIRETINQLNNVCEKHGWELDVAIHPMNHESFKNDELEKRCTRYRKFDEGLMPWLSRADVVVSDFSSSTMQFLCTGRPIILYNSFAWWEDTEGFDKEHPLWLMRNACYQYTGVEFLEGLIIQALNEGTNMAGVTIRANRLAIRDMLMAGIFDGRCTDRCMEAIHIVAGIDGDNSLHPSPDNPRENREVGPDIDEPSSADDTSQPDNS